MLKTIAKICIGGLIGLGIGRLVGQREIDKLEIERDDLLLHNKCLEANNEFLEMRCDNLKASNELFSNLLMQATEEDDREEA